MTQIWTPDDAYTNSMRRPFCACCGLKYSHPNFYGKVIIANKPGEKGQCEIIFCEKCARKEEAQEIYKELMAIDRSDVVIVPPPNNLILPPTEA